MCTSNNADFVKICVSYMSNYQFPLEADQMRLKKGACTSLHSNILADIVRAEIFKAVWKHLIEYCTIEKYKMFMVQDI